VRDEIKELENEIPEFLREEINPYEVQPAAQESVLQEAQRLTHGPRQEDYSHPLDDYTRTAALVNAALRHKLRVNLDPEDVTIIMALVKISRHTHKPKRDNMVDLAGYAWCTHEIIEERTRRQLTMTQAQSAGMQQRLVGQLNAERDAAVARQEVQK